MEKGLALMETKSDYKGSIKQFEHAIRDYPEYYEAYTQMGVAYLSMGNNAGAEPALRKALELSQYQYVEAVSWFVTLLNDTLRFVDAESLARRGLELEPGSWQLNVRAGSLFARPAPPRRSRKKRLGRCQVAAR